MEINEYTTVDPSVTPNKKISKLPDIRAFVCKARLKHGINAPIKSISNPGFINGKYAGAKKKIIKFPNNKPASLGFLEYTETASISAPINMLKGTNIEKIPNMANGFTIAATILKNVSGILIPGGFGKRGTEGKIAAINYARKNKIPFFGICFGMQMAIIEFARNRLNIKKATSSEFGPSKASVVGLMSEWTKDGKLMRGTDKELGGTMRLGSYEARLKKDTKISKIYNSLKINERHRHRYEVNINYRKDFENKGMIFSGLSPDNKLPETIELKDHPWFIGVQFHPEFKSRPLSPHPLFSSFIKAAKINSKK